MQHFSFCPHKSVAMYVSYRDYITLFSSENAPFAAGENKKIPLLGMQILMGMWFCSRKILQSRN